jgi:hypothetical protein
VLIGSVVLLRHFMHHRVHHIVQGDCSCDHHHHVDLPPLKVLSTAAALSLHSLAAGAILQKTLGPTPASLLAILLGASSGTVGAVIALVVRLGDTERVVILKWLDTVPGVVTTLLSGICWFALYRAIHHLLTPSELALTVYAFGAACISLGLGVMTHKQGKRSPATVGSHGAAEGNGDTSKIGVRTVVHITPRSKPPPGG